MSRGRLTGLVIIAGLPAAAGAAVPCGGSLRDLTEAMQAEAVAQGHDPEAAGRFFAAARRDERVILADRSRDVFRRDFVDFARNVIGRDRIETGRRNAERHAAVFDEAERRYGMSRRVRMAFRALESDYGAVRGDCNTLNALMTLGQDGCMGG